MIVRTNRPRISCHICWEGRTPLPLHTHTHSGQTRMTEEKSSRAWLTIIAPKSRNGSQLHLYTLYKKGCSRWGMLCLNAKWHRWRLFLGGFLKGAKIHKVTCQCLFKSHSSGDAEPILDNFFLPHRKKKRNVSESHARKAVNYSPDPSEWRWRFTVAEALQPPGLPPRQDRAYKRNASDIIGCVRLLLY